MKILNAFDRSTKFWVFTGEVKQQIDPVSKEPIPLRYATDKELPPEKEGFVRGFVTGEWEYYVDNIGKEYWLADGTKHTITELGEEVPEGALLEEPPEPEPTDEELASSVRLKRDSLISEMSWRYERHASEIRLGIETTDSIEALDEYAQALREITDQEGFPSVIDWPEAP
jgi:hypothetical protein